MGGSVWLLPEADVYAEPGGVWLGGDADVTVGLPSSLPIEVNLRAGAADVVVSWSGTGDGEVRLSAGEARTVTMVPSARTAAIADPRRVQAVAGLAGRQGPAVSRRVDLGAEIAASDVAQKRATPIT